MVVGVAAMAVGAVLVVIALVGRGERGGRAALGPTTSAATVRATPFAAGTTTPTLAAGVGHGVGPLHSGRRALRGFSEAKATVTSADGTTCEVCVLVAATAEQRSRGLMEVTDTRLGGYDGMVFVYDPPEQGAFYMRNTPRPLSVAYFDARGRYASALDMAPCSDAPDCRTYPASAPFGYAVEVPQGKLADVGVAPGARIRLDATRCPLASKLVRHAR